MSPTRTAFDEVLGGLPPAIRVTPRLTLSANRLRFLRFLDAHSSMSRGELMRELGSGHCVTYRTFRHLHRHGLIQVAFTHGEWHCWITTRGREVVLEHAQVML